LWRPDRLTGGQADRQIGWQADMKIILNINQFSSQVSFESTRSQEEMKPCTRAIIAALKL